MEQLILEKPIVSVEWLRKNLSHPNLVLLNATIPKATGISNSDTNEKQIPFAKFFDLKNKFSNVSAPFPTTFPSEEQFTKESQLLGICKNSTIVVYDDKGIYSSPRAWWLFKAFGFNNVAVLDGGFPAWIKEGYQIEDKLVRPIENGDFQATYQQKTMKFFEDVKKESDDKNFIIIDARSEARFKSLEAEPREGLRSGTIPNSVNLPFENLINEHGFLKSKTELKELFQLIAEPNRNMIFSCGSGITACVLALGAELAGYKKTSVYDGSWTEWGSLTT